MASDATIKAALGAATDQMCPTGRAACGPCRPACGHCTRSAAAAIAAFLRSLPDQYSRGGAGFWDAIPPEEETRLWLAAAVEEAARDE